MNTAAVTAALALAAAMLLPSTALAEGKGRARFRGGISAAGGVVAATNHPGGFGFATIGAQGEIGVQINDLVGLYWVPQFDIGFGDDLGGVNLSTAALVDFSPSDHFSVGAGPDVGMFAAIGDGGVAAGVNYGGRFSLAVHPFVSEGKNGRRKAFSIGADVRMLAGATGVLSAESGGSTGFVVQPMLTLGYTAF